MTLFCSYHRLTKSGALSAKRAAEGMGGGRQRPKLRILLQLSAICIAAVMLAKQAEAKYTATVIDYDVIYILTGIARDGAYRTFSYTAMTLTEAQKTHMRNPYTFSVWQHYRTDSLPVDRVYAQEGDVATTVTAWNKHVGGIDKPAVGDTATHRSKEMYDQGGRTTIRTCQGTAGGGDIADASWLAVMPGTSCFTDPPVPASCTVVMEGGTTVALGAIPVGEARTQRRTISVRCSRATNVKWEVGRASDKNLTLRGGEPGCATATTTPFPLTVAVPASTLSTDLCLSITGRWTTGGSKSASGVLIFTPD